MSYFPAFLDLSGKKCVVIGAGRVGRRKIRRLVQCAADPVWVIEPDPDPALIQDSQLMQDICLQRRSFHPSDLARAFLVVASTSDPELNTRIGHICREENTLCNVVDQPELCSLVVPALVSREDLTIAVSTGGASPALARRIRRQLEDLYGPEYAVWLRLLKRLRPAVLALGPSQADNASLFRSLTDEALLQAIVQADGPGLLSLVQARLPGELHPFAREVLHELDFSL